MLERKDDDSVIVHSLS